MCSLGVSPGPEQASVGGQKAWGGGPDELRPLGLQRGHFSDPSPPAAVFKTAQKGIKLKCELKNDWSNKK